MPRGIYDRTKKKGTTAAPVAAKTDAVRTQKKAPAGKTKLETKSTEVSEDVMGRNLAKLAVLPNRLADSMYGFNILGSNISTLSTSYAQIESTNPVLAGAIAKELVETVQTLTALRTEIFGTATKSAPVEVEAPPVEDEVVAAPVQPAPVVAPVATMPSLPQPGSHVAPVLPQGNASSYTPPAPPALPTLPNH